MNYMDIRRAFAERGDAVRKLKDRLFHWLKDLEQGYGPVDWNTAPALYLYIASIPSFDAGLVRIFGPEDRARVGSLKAMLSSARPGFSANGLLVSQMNNKCRYFALLTPEGELLHGAGPLLACRIAGESRNPYILVHDVEKVVISTLSANISRLAMLDFGPPYYVALALRRAASYMLVDEGAIDPPRESSARPVRHPFLLFDQILIEEDVHIIGQRIGHQSREVQERIWREQAARLKPILDRLYQAAGAEQSPIAHALD